MLHHAFVPTHPEPTDPKIFISHIPVLNFAGTARHVTPRICANPSWTYLPKIHHKTSARMIFHLTHLFWTLPEQLSMLHHACEPTHPEPTSQEHTTNFRSENFHLTHPCFELCRNSSPCYTTHVGQPIVYQRPKIHHKRLMTQFCKPILIQPPKIHLSKFQCSPYRRQKCRALQEDTVEWKPVCDLQARNCSQ